MTPVRCSRFCKQPGSLPSRSVWETDDAPVPPLLPLTSPHYCTRAHVPRYPGDFYYLNWSASYASPSPHHTLVLLTAPRRLPTLEPALASLKHAGVDQWSGPKILLSDGPLNLKNLEASWNLVIKRQEGCAKAFLHALRLGIAFDPDLDSLTFVEDDVELCKNALPYMASVVVPSVSAFITWFTYDYDWTSPRHPRQDPHPAEKSQIEHRALLATRPSRFFILTQSITLPRRTIDRVLACPHAARDWPKPHGHDELISWALGGAPYSAHFPILVQHTGGLNSAVLCAEGRTDAPEGDAQAGARTSPYYVGADFDALSLIPGGVP